MSTTINFRGSSSDARRNATDEIFMAAVRTRYAAHHKFAHDLERLHDQLYKFAKDRLGEAQRERSLAKFEELAFEVAVRAIREAFGVIDNDGPSNNSPTQPTSRT